MRIARLPLSPSRSTEAPWRDAEGRVLAYGGAGAAGTQCHLVRQWRLGDSRGARAVRSARASACRIRDPVASHLVMLNEVRTRADEFDIIHFHVDLLQHVLFRDLSHKCITTLHGRLDIPDFMPVFESFPEMPLISISNSQRAPMPRGVNWLATVYHGLPATVCPFHQGEGDYLAFLGRISPEKRPDRAIAITKAAGVPLKIAAKVDPADQVSSTRRSDRYWTIRLSSSSAK